MKVTKDNLTNLSLDPSIKRKQGAPFALIPIAAKIDGVQSPVLVVSKDSLTARMHEQNPRSVTITLGNRTTNVSEANKRKLGFFPPGSTISKFSIQDGKVSKLEHHLAEYSKSTVL